MVAQAERQQAVEGLHTRCAVAIYHKCNRMLGDPSEAEDAVQETFVRAYRSFESFGDRTAEEQLYWLYRTASYVCLGILRTRRRRRISAGSRPLEEVGDEGVAQDQQVGARFELQRVLAMLDERDQMVVVAHFVDGMNQSEVAAVLGVSRRAVVKRLTALRRRFGALFEEAGSNG